MSGPVCDLTGSCQVLCAVEGEMVAGHGPARVVGVHVGVYDGGDLVGFHPGLAQAFGEAAAVCGDEVGDHEFGLAEAQVDEDLVVFRLDQERADAAYPTPVAGLLGMAGPPVVPGSPEPGRRRTCAPHST